MVFALLNKEETFSSKEKKQCFSFLCLYMETAYSNKEEEKHCQFPYLN